MTASFQRCARSVAPKNGAVSDVLLWRHDEWRCELSFRGTDAWLRLYLDNQLISDRPVTAGLDAWQQAQAWKTAILQVYKTNRATAPDLD